MKGLRALIQQYFMTFGDPPRVRRIGLDFRPRLGPFLPARTSVFGSPDQLSATSPNRQEQPSLAVLLWHAAGHAHVGDKDAAIDDSRAHRSDNGRQHGRRQGRAVLAVVHTVRMVDHLLVCDVPAMPGKRQRRWRLLPAECYAAASRRVLGAARESCAQASSPALISWKIKGPGELALNRDL